MVNKHLSVTKCTIRTIYEKKLIPPFIMREAGIKVKEIPKIHLNNPDVEGQSIFFADFFI